MLCVVCNYFINVLITKISDLWSESTLFADNEWFNYWTTVNLEGILVPEMM